MLDYHFFPHIIFLEIRVAVLWEGGFHMMEIPK